MWEALNGKKVRKSTIRIPHAKFFHAKDNKKTKGVETQYEVFDMKTYRLEFEDPWEYEIEEDRRPAWLARKWRIRRMEDGPDDWATDDRYHEWF